MEIIMDKMVLDWRQNKKIKMSIKVQIAIFAQSRNLSEEILKKIIKLRKKLNIFLVVSDNEFRKKLIQNKMSDF